MKVWSLLLIFGFYFSLVDVGYSASKASGKSASKVGLAGIAISGGSSQQGYSVNGYDPDFGSSHNESRGVFNSIVAKLHYDVLTGYDKSIRPVRNHHSHIDVEIDFGYRQVLDLDEKNQVLKSYIWFRVYWQDEFLKWNPEEYDNISSITLPASKLWRPDIVIYEDTGNRDYSPRIQYAKVTSDGNVRYLEPNVYETTCSINIAYFPFDYQICTLTFTSWTFPTAKLDLSARRNEEEMSYDIENIFVKTGEWVLHDIYAIKESQNFGATLNAVPGTVSFDNTTGFRDTRPYRFYYLFPKERVHEIVPDRVTDLHWCAMQYTLKLRRNSSLYMQSMLFPAILLTTIALLGFYLPPDSGERIGLQITILLTYMVFLLTVGEMFPASSGPYLGMYYVICMGLLGVNLAMTVVVLHMHYMPADAVIEDGRGPNGETIAKTPPAWIRFIVFLAKRSLNGNCFAKSCKEETLTPKNQYLKPTENVPQNGNPAISKNILHSTVIKLRPDTIKEYTVNGNIHYSHDPMHVKESSYMTRSVQTDAVKKNHFYISRTKSDTNLESKLQTVESNNATKSIYEIRNFLKESSDELRERTRMSEIEARWKETARIVDTIALRAYLALLVICHLGILIAAICSQPDEPLIHKEHWLIEGD